MNWNEMLSKEGLSKIILDGDRIYVRIRRNGKFDAYNLHELTVVEFCQFMKGRVYE